MIMMTNIPQTKAVTIAYWIATTVAITSFAVPGVMNLARVPHIADDMARLGYPPYFLIILGTWKLLGALTIVISPLPRLKEWAYAGMLFDLTGAAASRVLAGDGATMLAPPLAIAIVVLASWTLRPSSRMLARQG